MIEGPLVVIVYILARILDRKKCTFVRDALCLFFLDDTFLAKNISDIAKR